LATEREVVVSNLRRPIAALLLVWYLPACQHMTELGAEPEKWQQPEGASPREVIEEQRPHEIRITLADGQQRIVRGPVVVNDTLAGLEVSPGAKSFAIPIDQVVAIETLSGYEKSKRAVFPLLLGVGLVVGVLFLVGLSTFGEK
jgi:hypothetical protein